MQCQEFNKYQPPASFNVGPFDTLEECQQSNCPCTTTGCVLITNSTSQSYPLYSDYAFDNTGNCQLWGMCYTLNWKGTVWNQDLWDARFSFTSGESGDDGLAQFAGVSELDSQVLFDRIKEYDGCYLCEFYLENYIYDENGENMERNRRWGVFTVDAEGNRTAITGRIFPEIPALAGDWLSTGGDFGACPPIPALQCPPLQ